MKILIIGGTIFLGRHLIEAALAKGHEVTIFNRGRHNADLFPEVEKLRGDRENDVSALQGRSWDAAIDTCGYVPGVVKKSVEVLRDNIENYIFISSCSVYGNFNPDGSDENSSVAELTSEQVKIAEQIDTGDRVNASIYRESYGGLKALCEQTAEKLMPNRVLNVRAGLIVGEYDSVERFTYWVKRISDGGKVLAPGKPNRRVRIIDARDLAEWIIRMAEKRRVGTYNATGAEDGLTMEKMLEEIRSVSGSDAKFVWANEEFLEEQKVEAWSEMPLWLSEKYNGIFEVKNDKAIADGLTFHSLSKPEI
ncbi:MAG: NAD-dependent epimerase/dehydratase family protein [Acidobacteria bacterium]|nr:NAD-dependent epimerase/dehydratase family protein [Acidobacteriota bacterium]